MKKYKTIVADPPWPYNCTWGSSRTPLSYPTMTVADIAALPVANIADEHCDLYLWTTQRFLPHAFGVINAWGFRYCQILTWCKTPMGLALGGLYCPTTEFLLLGRKGKMPTGKRRQDSTWWQVTRTLKHSKKPEFFQDLIEQQSDGPRVELFARRQRAGWDVWGNEVECTAELT